MNRFRKHDRSRKGDESSSSSTSPPPLREYKDESTATSPSMSFFRFEVTAYWLLPLIIFSVILFGGIYLAFKFDVFFASSEEVASPVPYRGPFGDVLVPELLDSYLEAVGGRQALEGVRSFRCKGRLIETSGEVPFQILVSLPDKGMMITDPGEAFSQKLVLNGNKAWQVVGLGDGGQKIVPLGELNTASLMWSLRVHNTFRRLALEESGEGFSAREIEFSGEPCFELKKTMPDGAEFVAVLDSENLYLLKTVETAPGAEGMERLEVVYDDHRLVSGIVHPYETKTYKRGKLYNEVYLESIEINPGVISSLFAVPEELSK